jgi:hypothetical protein
MIAASTKRVKLLAFTGALLAAADAAAATIYGFIQQNNQPVRSSDVVLSCGGTDAGRAVTDERGNYRITTARGGRCLLYVGGASGEVVLYPEPTQYNFEIVRAQLVRR